MNAYQSEVETFNECLTTQGKVIARNCKIDDLVVTGAILGGTWAADANAQVECMQDNGMLFDDLTPTEAHLQLQAKCEDALKCVHVGLRQSGNDVVAWIEGAAYAAPHEHCGFDFPRPIPIAMNADDAGYGVARLYYSTSIWQSVGTLVTQHASQSFNDFLSKEEKIIAYNVNINDLRVTGAVLGGSWAANTCARAECVKRTRTEMRLQLQAACHDYLKAVHITLRQEGANVVARADWAAALSGWEHQCGYDFSTVTFAPIAQASGDAGYGVVKMFLKRAPRLDVGTFVSSTNEMIKVMLRPHIDVAGEDIRIGLHWMDGDAYGGWIADKAVVKDGYDRYHAEFNVDEIAQKVAGLPRCPSRYFPIVFFTHDGTFEHAWYKTSFQGALNTPGMQISLYPMTLQCLERKYWKHNKIFKKQQDRKRMESRRQELASAEYVYIDGNNFCWDNSGNNPRRFGIALLDRILCELKRPSNRVRFPNLKIRLFFDGGITHSYRSEFLERLNDGSVIICPSKADPKLTEESRHNGCEDKTFVLSNDHFDEFGDYSVVGNNRLVTYIFDNGFMRIPDMDLAFGFNPSHFGHVPMRNPPCGTVAVRSHSAGQFLCADASGQSDSRPIFANRDRVADRERFVILRNSDGTVSLKAKANGKYLTALINDGGRLVALADKIDAWEKFWMTKRIGGGEHYILRSYANMKYVSVNPDTGWVCASADVADEWEWLTISRL